MVFQIIIFIVLYQNMGNSQRPQTKARSVYSHNTLISNVITQQIVPSGPKSLPGKVSAECQAGSVIHDDAPMDPLQSPKSESYSGQLHSLISSANVSNKNVIGQQGFPNHSQHIESQVISNFLSGILVQETPKEQQRKTEYSEGKQEDNNLYLTK